jgi:DNA replication protein DnaC
MRTEQRWNEVIQSKIIDRLFPARLAKDLKDLKLKPLHNEGSYFIYSGRKATGKTVMACRILLGHEYNDYIQSRTHSSKFLTVTDFLNELKHSFDAPHESEIDILYKYQDIDILVLDDLGTNKMSDWAYQILYSLINHRYDWLKTTIITSNHTLEELQECWQDDRITSRIKRMCELLPKEKY